jgi:hypothetical protein
MIIIIPPSDKNENCIMSILAFNAKKSLLSVLRRLSSTSAEPKGVTGIEHAEALKTAGKDLNHPADTYKVGEYHSTSHWSYYDIEMSLVDQRLPQPSPKRPDVMPKINKPEDKPKK